MESNHNLLTKLMREYHDVVHTDYFRMFEYKIRRCPNSAPHDWTNCPWAHPTEKARRRDPCQYKYNGTACADFRKGKECSRNDACPFAHGVFEAWLHPTRYRTLRCTGSLVYRSCSRPVCFFAHYDETLRESTVENIDVIKHLNNEMYEELQQDDCLFNKYEMLLLTFGVQHTASREYRPRMQRLVKVMSQCLPEQSFPTLVCQVRQLQMLQAQCSIGSANQRPELLDGLARMLAELALQCGARLAPRDEAHLAHQISALNMDWQRNLSLNSRMPAATSQMQVPHQQATVTPDSAASPGHLRSASAGTSRASSESLGRSVQGHLYVERKLSAVAQIPTDSASQSSLVLADGSGPASVSHLIAATRFTNNREPPQSQQRVQPNER